MLKVELACQEFDRETGNDGKIVWPIDVSEDQLTEVMTIPGVWTPNTRKRDQLEGSAVWAIRDVLMLVTVLKSWVRKKHWTAWFLACFETDPDLKRGWELRMTFTEDDPCLIDMGETQELDPALGGAIELTEVVEEPPCRVLLTNVVEKLDFVLLPGEVPNRDTHRQWLKDHMIVRRMLNRIHNPLLREEEKDDAKDLTSPFAFDDEEMNILVSNLGQEDQLW